MRYIGDNVSHTRVHQECIELLLGAITSHIGDDGMRASFLFGKVGAKHWEKHMGANIYYHPRELVLACLYLRKNGPAYLRALPLDAIRKLLQNFITDNYCHLAKETFLQKFEKTYAQHISTQTKLLLADELDVSAIFKPALDLTLYPLVPIIADKSFVSDAFFLLSPAELARKGISDNFAKWITADSFPPLVDWKGKMELGVGSWLGIRSPVIQAANKTKAAILGAIALTSQPMYRYMFSGRHQFGGYCTITADFRTTISSGESHTPPLMHNIELTDRDHPWLAILVAKLCASDKATRRQLRALKYFYRAWYLDPSERFPVLCMALDAIFGDANNATQAVIHGVQNTIGSHISDERLRQLMSLRAAVIHGGAPDVYDSSKYAKYYTEHGCDPIFDMELVVAQCIRIKVFGTTLMVHLDPNAEVIRQHQEKGTLPIRLHPPSILDETEAMK